MLPDFGEFLILPLCDNEEFQLGSNEPILNHDVLGEAKGKR